MLVQEANYWKVGLFVASGFLAIFGTLFYLGAQKLSREKLTYLTFFDESVQGLDPGAPVKMRGVTIGTVTGITIAPDNRLVQVTSECFVDAMVRLGLGKEEELKNYSAPIPPDLRVQLATTGITGVKFLLVDFFEEPGDGPTLEFEVPRGYLPSAPSTLKSIEDSFYTLADSLPDTLESVTRLARTLEQQVAAVDIVSIQSEASALIQHVDEVVVAAGGKLEAVDVGALAKLLSEDLTALKEAIRKADRLLDKLDAPDGPLGRVVADIGDLTDRADALLASTRQSVEQSDLPGTTATVRETVAAYGSLANDGHRMMDQTAQTLVLLRETLAAVQALAATIERQPGSFLQGRSPDSPRPNIKK